MSNKNSNPGAFRNESGFTLIELSILVVVVGLVISGVLALNRVQLEQKRLDRIAEGRHILQKALVDFISDDALHAADNATQRYPCPADPALTPDDADFGIEQITGPGGPCRVVGGIVSTPGTGGIPVFIGAMPVVTLGLDKGANYDIYNHQYTYAVSGNLAQTGAMLSIDQPGSIEVKNDAATLTTTAQFVVVSHGRSGAGAYTLAGTRNACTTGTLDEENCNDDGIFNSLLEITTTPAQKISQIVNYAPGASFFDDHVIISLGDDRNDGWMKATDLQQSHITTRNTGNFGVGVIGRNPTDKLEVVGGNISTSNNIQADRNVEAGETMRAKSFTYTN